MTACGRVLPTVLFHCFNCLCLPPHRQQSAGAPPERQQDSKSQHQAPLPQQPVDVLHTLPFARPPFRRPGEVMGAPNTHPRAALPWLYSVPCTAAYGRAAPHPLPSGPMEHLHILAPTTVLLHMCCLMLGSQLPPPLSPSPPTHFHPPPHPYIHTLTPVRPTHPCTAMILGGGPGTDLWPLTNSRAEPAVPFAGLFRLIDVPLSNCIHSGVRQIYVLTQYNSTRHALRARA